MFRVPVIGVLIDDVGVIKEYESGGAVAVPCAATGERDYGVPTALLCHFRYHDMGAMRP